MSPRSLVSDDQPLSPGPRECTPREIVAAASRLRSVLEAEPLPLRGVASSISETCRRFGSQTSSTERAPATAAAIAERWGWPASSLPIHLVCEAWSSRERVEAFGQTLRPRHEVIGFILPGNLPGAGLHEIVTALLAGCAVMIKTASAEPIFFADLAHVLTEVDAVLGARIAVFNWGRERGVLTEALRANCDRLVVFGDDATIAELAGNENGAGFGTRVSGIVLAGETPNPHENARILETIAREVAYFEQRGCLSPHHALVGVSTDRDASDWARRLAMALDALGRDLVQPPRTIALGDAAAIRRVRETARWRALGGHPVELWEGPIPGWTVVYDRDASFTVSPGFRTMYVSPFFDAADLERRLAPVAGHIEAMGLTFGAATDSSVSVAALRKIIEAAGATWICEPGRMQAPPLDWTHGGGDYLRMMRGAS